MTARAAKALPPPTAEERDRARAAAAVLRIAIENPTILGKQSVVHVDLSRPRRGEWWVWWSNLPGFTRIIGSGVERHRHDLLPGWEYLRREIAPEMIPDLEALAERGERPTEATRR